MINDNIKLVGSLDITVLDSSGNVKEKRKEKNLVVSAGLAFIASRMKDTSATAMSHMAVGSGSTAAAAGDTDLGSILGSREVLDSTTVAAGVATYVSSFEAGDGTGAVTEAGIFNASTAGTMLCRTVFATVNKGADDTMTITWTITLSAS
jgi:hypothetical protein